MENDRNAGRKRKFNPETIKNILDLYSQGHSVSELAGQYGVSRQTMSFYVNDVAFEMEIESGDNHLFPIRGISYWNRLNRVFGIPKEELKDYSLRLDYMREEEVYSSILANYKDERILVKNFSEHPMKCAFGVKRNPTWEDYNLFLEERCVPRSRDHMKLILRDYELDFYDPLSIIEKTGGRMAGDDRHIKVYSLEALDERV